MSTKQKLLTSVIGSLLVLIIIGLTIAIVIVANQLAINNSMSIVYNVTDVACIITPTAKTYNSKGEKVEDLVVSPEYSEAKIGDEPNGTVGESETPNAKVGNFEFGKANLTASGYVVYNFAIKNTATAGGEDITANIIFDAKDIENQNIVLKIGETQTSATEVTSFVIDTISPQETKNIVVIISIANNSLSVDLELLSVLYVSLV